MRDKGPRKRRWSLVRAGFRRALAATLVLAGSSGGVPAAAQGVDRQARVWAAACTACHGVDGNVSAAAASLILAGRDAQAIYRALLAFKAGQVPSATVMPQLAKGYADDELLRIARYLASLSVP